ncbi:MAG TPA: thioesterase family protein [Prolixibacteraceae bacterium]|nr:thioesterase family protein [Prolixibacteraceae bacterium]
MNGKLIFNERIYTYQIDFVGHVNNIVYVQWMENGRIRLLEAIGLPAFDLAAEDGILPVLTKTSIRYRKPIFLNNTVTIEMWISQLNNASAIMDFNFKNEKSELCATGQQSGLFIDRKTKRPARLSQGHRAAFEKFLITG